MPGPRTPVCVDGGHRAPSAGTGVGLSHGLHASSLHPAFWCRQASACPGPAVLRKHCPSRGDSSVIGIGVPTGPARGLTSSAEFRRVHAVTVQHPQSRGSVERTRVTTEKQRTHCGKIPPHPESARPAVGRSEPHALPRSPCTPSTETSQDGQAAWPPSLHPWLEGLPASPARPSVLWETVSAAPAQGQDHKETRASGDFVP